MKVFSRLNLEIKSATMSDEEIMKWLEKNDRGFKRNKYTIKNGVVDVKGIGCDLRKKGITEFPFQFGVVDGDFFNCSHNNLTSLKGSPKITKCLFDCSHNKLTSLKDGPEKVGGYFDCSHNNLTSLTGAPKKVSGYFYCNKNKAKFTVEDVQDVIGKKDENEIDV